MLSGVLLAWISTSLVQCKWPIQTALLRAISVLRPHTHARQSSCRFGFMLCIITVSLPARLASLSTLTLIHQIAGLCMLSVSCTVSSARRSWQRSCLAADGYAVRARACRQTCPVVLTAAVMQLSCPTRSVSKLSPRTTTRTTRSRPKLTSTARRSSPDGCWLLCASRGLIL